MNSSAMAGWVALATIVALSPLLASCAFTGALLKVKCTLYTDFTVDKCVVYPKLVRKPKING